MGLQGMSRKSEESQFRTIQSLDPHFILKGKSVSDLPMKKKD